MILSVILYALAVVIFTGFDVWGYGDMVQGKKLAVAPYRIMQLTLQAAIYAALVWRHEWAALAAFMFAHWSFGCDWLYYVVRGEDYRGYTITWFSVSLPSLVYRMTGEPFTGHDLEWIGPSACALGLIVAGVFA